MGGYLRQLNVLHCRGSLLTDVLQRSEEKEFDRPGRYLPILYPQLRPTDSLLPLPLCTHHPLCPRPDGAARLYFLGPAKLFEVALGRRADDTDGQGCTRRSVCPGCPCWDGRDASAKSDCTIYAFPQKPTTRSRKNTQTCRPWCVRTLLQMIQKCVKIENFETYAKLEVGVNLNSLNFIEDLLASCICVFIKATPMLKPL